VVDAVERACEAEFGRCDVVSGISERIAIGPWVQWQPDVVTVPRHRGVSVAAATEEPRHPVSSGGHGVDARSSLPGYR
jgi:hypothetical protein